jgi:hypothetical protein
MMGRLDRDQGQFLYCFNLEEVVPEDHLVRVTGAPRTPPKMGRVHHLEGDGHEAEPVHGRTDHRDFARADETMSGLVHDHKGTLAGLPIRRRLEKLS